MSKLQSHANALAVAAASAQPYLDMLRGDLAESGVLARFPESSRTALGRLQALIDLVLEDDAPAEVIDLTEEAAYVNAEVAEFPFLAHALASEAH